MNAYLDTAIAVILVVVIFSVIAYVIQELIAANLEYRGKMLKNSIMLLLDGQNATTKIADAIYNHPQIKKLKESAGKLPSYVPSANFALAIIDEVAKKAPAATGNDLFTEFKNGINAFAGAGGDLNTLLTNYINTSSDLKELQANIEKWYNEYMDRVSGWYKKSTRLTLRVIAVIIAIGFNVDLIKVAQEINSNDNLRASLVSSADKLADQPEYIKKLYEVNINTRIAQVDEVYKDTLLKARSSGLKDTIEIKNKIAIEQENILKNYTKNRIVDIDDLLKKIDNKELPIGWSKKTWDEFGENLLITLLGWFLAAVAISMGAPFWFDLLIKLVNIRRAGIKPKDKD
ncbi:MAG TPA: hypothetical protein PL108_09610 [Sediminibacterium sp.]|nr:hypothetical protein [Sediminibacterium sp.]